MGMYLFVTTSKLTCIVIRKQRHIIINEATLWSVIIQLGYYNSEIDKIFKHDNRARLQIYVYRFTTIDQILDLDSFYCFMNKQVNKSCDVSTCLFESHRNKSIKNANLYRYDVTINRTVIPLFNFVILHQQECLSSTCNMLT